MGNVCLGQGIVVALLDYKVCRYRLIAQCCVFGEGMKQCRAAGILNCCRELNCSAAVSKR